MILIIANITFTNTNITFMSTNATFMSSTFFHFQCILKLAVLNNVSKVLWSTRKDNAGEILARNMIFLSLGIF